MLSLRTGYPTFDDLPWEYSIQDWYGRCPRLEEIQRGLARHPVVFVSYQGTLFAIKELPPQVAKREFDLLVQMEEQRLPCVTPVGYGQVVNNYGEASILITRFLDGSLPYRSLFMRGSLDRYRSHLLDAMAGLLVQLHLAGLFWGDCSLSNTLFRRDAGALQAYLVDAETAEAHPPRLSPILRHHDLEIMRENLSGDLLDLEELGFLPPDYPVLEIGETIQQSYRSLWEEITHEAVIKSEERYRIHEKIQALNNLGFSVKDIELLGKEDGELIHIRPVVTDRNYHRDVLLELTGVEAEEMQARQMMNEIYETRAYLSQARSDNVPLSVAAYHWLENTYQPVVDRLKCILVRPGVSQTAAELYCQVLEHKWFLSERAHSDVGHRNAVEDYLLQFE